MPKKKAAKKKITAPRWPPPEVIEKYAALAPDAQTAANAFDAEIAALDECNGTTVDLGGTPQLNKAELGILEQRAGVAHGLDGRLPALQLEQSVDERLVDRALGIHQDRPQRVPGGTQICGDRQHQVGVARLELLQLRLELRQHLVHADVLCL